MSQEQFSEIKLANISDGAAEEIFALNLKKIVKNILDETTEAKTKRKINLEFTFATDENREQLICMIKADCKLAPTKTVNETLWIARGEDGHQTAFQSNFRQSTMFDGEVPLSVIGANQ